MDLPNSALADQSRLLAKTLIERGFEVTFISSGAPSKHDNATPSCTIVRRPNFVGNRFKTLKLFNRLLIEKKPSVVVTNFSIGHHMQVLAWLHRIPVRICFYRISAGFLNMPLRNKIKTIFYYMFPTTFFSVSEAMVPEIVNTFKVPRRKVSVHYNGLEDPKLYTGKQPSNRNLIIAARLLYGKGIDVMLNALPKVLAKHPEVKLKIVGSGKDEQSLKNQASRMGLLDSAVFFLGQKSHQETIELFAESYLSVLPSRFEAFGYVIIESFSVGTPVVASGIGGIKELIKPGIHGLLVPKEDPSALADAIIKILDDPKLRETMGNNAHARFLADFQLKDRIQEQADHIEKMFNDMC